MEVHSTIIFERVAAEVRRGHTIDIYTLAADLHAQLPEIDKCALLQLVEKAVVESGGTALWEPRQVQST